mgnify:CR=1 FL=1
MDNSYIEQLENFLGGTFHQDIDSIQEALNKYIDECDKEWLNKIIISGEKFLQSDISDDNKDKFIEDSTEIYFESINMNPREWLNCIINTLKKEVNKQHYFQ